MTWRIASFFNENFFIYLDDPPTRRAKKDSQRNEANAFEAVSCAAMSFAPEDVERVEEASCLF